MSVTPKQTIFYIVRHGETDWNVLRRIQGHSDNALNAVGEQQARAAAVELKDIHFDRIFSSDLLRAKRTAELVKAERTLAIDTTSALRERMYGKLEGKLVDEVEDVYEKLAKAANKQEEDELRHSLEMETTDELVSRVFMFLRETAVAYAGKTILIVSHGGLMRAIIEHLGYYGPKSGTQIRFFNTGYMKLESDGTDFTLKELKRYEIL